MNKPIEASTGQSGEVEGLLREADDYVAGDEYHSFGSVQIRSDSAALIHRLAAALRAQGAGEPVAWVTIQPDRPYWTESETLADKWRADGLNVIAYCAHPVSQPPSGQATDPCIVTRKKA